MFSIRVEQTRKGSIHPMKMNNYISGIFKGNSSLDAFAMRPRVATPLRKVKE